MDARGCWTSAPTGSTTVPKSGRSGRCHLPGYRRRDAGHAATKARGACEQEALVRTMSSADVLVAAVLGIAAWFALNPLRVMGLPESLTVAVNWMAAASAGIYWSPLIVRQSEQFLGQDNGATLDRQPPWRTFLVVVGASALKINEFDNVDLTGFVIVAALCLRLCPVRASRRASHLSSSHSPSESCDHTSASRVRHPASQAQSCRTI